MEHISVSVITVGYKHLAIGRIRLDDTPIHSNQAGAFIDRQGCGD